MLPSRAYDRAWQLARAEEVSVPEILRRALKLPPPDKPER